MEAQAAPIQRRVRIDVDIPVIVTTVLDSMEATIADLNEQGALITGCTLAVGARIQIDHPGQTLYAQCQWAEVDRAGVKFVYPLADGPLFERLTIARATQMPSDGHSGTVMPFPHVHARAHAGARSFGRAIHGGFGRRAG